jgi:hypothetical protein
MACFYPLKGYVAPGGGITFSRKHSNLGLGQHMDVPCGKCIACLKRKSNEWAIRLYHEACMFRERDLGCSFITLTYNDEKCPIGVKPFTHAKPMRSLRLGDITRFMKSLRQILEREWDASGIRYYIAGEYGPDTERPHYHGVIFGWSFPDREPLGVRGKSRANLYRSRVLDRSWSYEGESLGYHSVGEELNPQSISYVTKYITKIGDFGEKDPNRGRREVERANMSRMPGLGASWIEKYWQEVYHSDSVIFGEREVKPPRFYDRYLAKHQPAVWSRVSAERKKAGIAAADELACEVAANPFRMTEKEEYMKLTTQKRDAF